MRPYHQPGLRKASNKLVSLHSHSAPACITSPVRFSLSPSVPLETKAREGSRTASLLATSVKVVRAAMALPAAVPSRSLRAPVSAPTTPEPLTTTQCPQSFMPITLDQPQVPQPRNALVHFLLATWLGNILSLVALCVGIGSFATSVVQTVLARWSAHNDALQSCINANVGIRPVPSASFKAAR